MTTSSEVRQAIERMKIDLDNQHHNFTVLEEPANLIDTITFDKVKNSEPCGGEAHDQVSQQQQASLKKTSKCRCNRKASNGKNVSDVDSDAKAKDHPIQSIEASLRRWLVLLEEHEVQASYADLLLLHASAKRFMDLVDFYFLTLIDLLMKTSQLFKQSDVSFDDGISFPPKSTLKISATERSKVDISYGTTYKTQLRSRGCSSPQVQRHAASSKKELSDTLAVRDDASRPCSDLHVLQDWLTDGIDYLEHEPINVYYEDFRILQSTTKRLLELLDLFFKNLVESLLERCVLRADHENKYSK